MTIAEDVFRRVTPYTPGEQPQYADKVKLNTNENPYPPSPEVEKVWKSLSEEGARLYPDPSCRELVRALAERYGVDEDQVFVGVGSDEVLALSFLSFFNSDRPLLFPEITYSFYPVWAELYGIPYRRIPLEEGTFAIRGSDYGAGAEPVENGGIVIANPNAPTSRYESLALIRAIADANRQSVVIVDEAYIDFAGEAGESADALSALSLLPECENILVIQTFSKARSMAGMRIGYAIGAKKLIAQLHAVKNSFNSYTLNAASILCGAAAVRDRAYTEKNLDKIKATRARAKEELGKLGFAFNEPSANFIFVRHPQIDVRELFSYLRDRRIFVRHFDDPLITDYLRITIGTDEEMERLYAAIRDFMKGGA